MKQRIHQDYLIEDLRCKEEKITRPKLEDYLSCNAGCQLYTFVLGVANGASFARFQENFDHISCLSATWNESETELFFNSTVLLKRINFSCSNEEKFNLMLFLSSLEFENGIRFILDSPTNFRYIKERKMRENSKSKKIANEILKGKTEKEDIKSFLSKRTILY